MSGVISTGYQEIPREEWTEVMSRYANAWKHPDIPLRQYELCTKPELEHYRAGIPVAPFDALKRVLDYLPKDINHAGTSLLDIGASTGYYADVLRIQGFRFNYTAVDFSEHFERLARRLNPLIRFYQADAAHLPFADGYFDIVLSGACIMHAHDYERFIAEAVRVSKRFVIFHRTPIIEGRHPTTLYKKEAYGVLVCELAFAEAELFELFQRYGLTLMAQTDVFWAEEQHFGHRTYLLSKDPVVHSPE